MISTKALATFFQSPLNVVGLVVAVATAADTAYTEYLNHTIQWATFLGGEASALFLLIFPDSTQVATDIKQTITDALKDWAVKDPAGLSVVLADVIKTIEDSTTPQTPTPTPSVTTTTTVVTKQS